MMHFTHRQIVSPDTECPLSLSRTLNGWLSGRLCGAGSGALSGGAGGAALQGSVGIAALVAFVARGSADQSIEFVGGNVARGVPTKCNETIWMENTTNYND